MKNQRQNIRNLFLSRPNIWIPVYELSKLALQYNTRIKEIKEDSLQPLNIVNKKQRVNGEWHSWYMLILPQIKPQQLTWGIEGRKVYTNAERIS